ncbi:DUF982 domain-containing protein [Rhizobium sp. 42MFCr.1]|jgi:hypothetical protein|uniref:DUF982 domain-containing protein n=1 Tax=Rhizobium sp. 42MFCr.1 TaxID=1048680 RepID=UPI000A074F06
MKNEARRHSIIYWRAPIHVRIGNGWNETIFGPADAVEYLKYRWPADRGPHYLAAMRACSGALCRRESPDFARDLFVAAAIEGDMLA